jgi:hypothetical protein
VSADAKTRWERGVFQHACICKCVTSEIKVAIGTVINITIVCGWPWKCQC